MSHTKALECGAKLGWRLARAALVPIISQILYDKDRTV